MDNNDHTWTYEFQTGNEIEELAHTNVQDVSIFSGLIDTNLDGNANVIGLDAAQDEYRLLLSADFGQIPFNPSMNVHSVSLGMYLEDLNFGAGATGMTFTVHRVITTGWSEQQQRGTELEPQCGQQLECNPVLITMQHQSIRSS